MRILIFNFEYPPLGGGGGVATQALGRELARRHEVHVITSAWVDTEGHELDRGMHVHRVAVRGRKRAETASLFSMALFVPLAWWRGWKLMRGLPFDVVNAQFVVPSGMPAACLARWFKVPFVLSFIGGDVYDPTKGVSPHRHPFLRWVIRRIADHAIIATAISEDVKKKTKEIHGVTTDIVVTHLGFTPVNAISVTRSELNWEQDGVVWVSIGRLIARKGFQRIIDQWRPEFGTLVIVGGGPDKEKLMAQIVDREMEEHIELAGSVSDERKQQILDNADAYVSAAEHEGFGIVFLEAMAAGLPVVAPNDGGQMDFLNELNASVFTQGDDEGLAESLSMLSADSGLRQRLGENARGMAQDFTWEKAAEQFEAVLIRAEQEYEDWH